MSEQDGVGRLADQIAELVDGGESVEQVLAAHPELAAGAEEYASRVAAERPARGEGAMTVSLTAPRPSDLGWRGL